MRVFNKELMIAITSCIMIGIRMLTVTAIPDCWPGAILAKMVAGPALYVFMVIEPLDAITVV